MKPTATIKIDNHHIGGGHPVFVVAEIGQAHDGSLGTAHAYIDAVAKTGAQAIKFQTHIAEAESSPGEAFRKNFSYQDDTRYEYWKRMEFSSEQWAGLKRHADEVGLVFLSSPFSHEAANLLEKLQVAAWKVGSGEVTNLPFLEKLATTGKPILLSTGVSSWREIDEAVECIQSKNAQMAIFQCTTAYPCPAECIGLNLIDEIKHRYNCPVGLSDHSGEIYSSLAATTLGASIIEVHTVFSKEVFGPDTVASVTTTDLKKLVDGCTFIRTAQNSPQDKDKYAEDNSDLKILFGKGLYVSKDLQTGSVLREEDIAFKKPVSGIPAKLAHRVVGLTLKNPIKSGSPILESDLEK
jgi:N,N'-diacetyllegionaminate synthase